MKRCTVQDRYGGSTQPRPSRGLSLALFSMHIPKPACGQANTHQRTWIHSTDTEHENSCMGWAGKPKRRLWRMIGLRMAGRNSWWWTGNDKRHDPDFDAGSARPLLTSARFSTSSISSSMRPWNFIIDLFVTRVRHSLGVSLHYGHFSYPGL
jgi:hypothetical protein